MDGPKRVLRAVRPSLQNLLQFQRLALIGHPVDGHQKKMLRLLHVLQFRCSEHDIHHGIGIHGTNDPGSIGSKASNGCVRMLNEEVVEVAALAFKGMIVTVVE